MKNKGCGNLFLTICLYLFLIPMCFSIISMMPGNFTRPEYWFLFAIIVIPTFYSIPYRIANWYVNKERMDIVLENELLTQRSTIDSYYQSQDKLYTFFEKVSKYEFLLNPKKTFLEKPSKLMRDYREGEDRRVHAMLDRTVPFYKQLIRETGPGYSSLFEKEINEYSDRMSADNRKYASVCLFMVKQFEKVVGTIDEVDTMEGSEFEEWCAELLTKHGFNSVKVTGKSGDQGVDITAEKSGVRYAIQCKRYSSDLDNTPVQEVYAGRMVYRCQVGVVMTNQHFTAGAKDLAENTGVLLWDRDKLIEMLETAQ